jgi:peptidoglycan/xylan/chitin deacetylase (PgdA/CDA1 family)
MIGILTSHQSVNAGRIVLAAIRRSVSRTQASLISRDSIREHEMIVGIDLPDEWGKEVLEWMQSGGKKILLLGNIPGVLAENLGFTKTSFLSGMDHGVRSEAAMTGAFAQSPVSIGYNERAGILGASSWRRPAERFDFTDEWNNLGYGAIRFDGSRWSISIPYDAGDATIASVLLDSEHVASYAALVEQDRASVLWVNRSVGPCDSFEWRLVETFLSSHRHHDLPCQPVIREIPLGYDAAITSRLDCDEDVESARSLWKAYAEHQVPFSLAVHTSNLADQRHHPILRELLAANGAVLAHSATHAPHWGGSYDSALQEASQSKELLEKATGHPIHYAVAPFHQAAPYALQALSDAGYRGCIGGIIRNDPEFLMARGGELESTPSGFIGHSQQCMFHGECMLREGDPLAVFKQAFDRAYETGTLFGYLDHPFSERYSYGWSDEQSRTGAHLELIQHIREKAGNPIFLNEEQAMDFLWHRSRVQIIEQDGRFIPGCAGDDMSFMGVEYRGKEYSLKNGGGIE